MSWEAAHKQDPCLLLKVGTHRVAGLKATSGSLVQSPDFSQQTSGKYLLNIFNNYYVPGNYYALKKEQPVQGELALRDHTVQRGKSDAAR